MVGGYLNPGGYNISLPFHLWTTKDSSQFYALFSREGNDSISDSTSEASRVDRSILEFLSRDRGEYVKAGLLMPESLSTVSTYKIRRALQAFIKERGYVTYRFATLWSILDKRVVQARDDKIILDMVNAYAVKQSNRMKE